MKRFLSVVFAGLTLSLAGCGWFEKNVVATTTGYSRMCADGVLYYQFSSGVAVAYTQEGKVKTCE